MFGQLALEAYLKTSEYKLVSLLELLFVFIYCVYRIALAVDLLVQTTRKANWKNENVVYDSFVWFDVYNFQLLCQGIASR